MEITILSVKGIVYPKLSKYEINRISSYLDLVYNTGKPTNSLRKLKKQIRKAIQVKRRINKGKDIYAYYCETAELKQVPDMWNMEGNTLTRDQMKERLIVAAIAEKGHLTLDNSDTYDDQFWEIGAWAGYDVGQLKKQTDGKKVLRESCPEAMEFYYEHMKPSVIQYLGEL